MYYHTKKVQEKDVLVPKKNRQEKDVFLSFLKLIEQIK